MINKAILVGRLTKDPEVRETSTSICNFTVAIPRKYVKQGEQRQSDFINCVAFGRTADFIGKFFDKGNLISIDGSIQTRTWDDTEGKRHWVTEVIVDDAGFVEGKKDGQQEQTEQAAEDLPDMPEGFGDVTDSDDLPF